MVLSRRAPSLEMTDFQNKRLQSEFKMMKTNFTVYIGQLPVKTFCKVFVNS